MLNLLAAALLVFILGISISPKSIFKGELISIQMALVKEFFNYFSYLGIIYRIIPDVILGI